MDHGKRWVAVEPSWNIPGDKPEWQEYRYGSGCIHGRT